MMARIGPGCGPGRPASGCRNGRTPGSSLASPRAGRCLKARIVAGGLLLGALLSSPRPVQAAAQSAAACDASGVAADWPRIHVLVTGVHGARGNVTLTLYGDRPEAFLKHQGSLVVTRVMLTTLQAEACLAVSVPGIYALAVYHDANNNHHFDRTPIGLPAEGYGFSNDAPTLLGPPNFSAARFTVPAGGTRLAIRLRY